jgi:hypothetical protein
MTRFFKSGAYYVISAWHLAPSLASSCWLLASVVSHYTLHITRYTLHVTHYTLHITRYTLHVTHYTLHITRYTLHVSHYTLHITR